MLKEVSRLVIDLTSGAIQKIQSCTLFARGPAVPFGFWNTMRNFFVLICSWPLRQKTNAFYVVY